MYVRIRNNVMILCNVRDKIIMIHRPWDRTRAYPGRNNGGVFRENITFIRNLYLTSYVRTFMHDMLIIIIILSDDMACMMYV